MNTKNIREQIAAVQHQQWSKWMEYLFTKGTKNEDGTFTIPAWAVERWTRQTNTPYSQLTDKEQESDRVEADKILQLIKGVCEEVIGDKEQDVTIGTKEQALSPELQKSGVRYTYRNNLRKEQRQRLSELLGEEQTK